MANALEIIEQLGPDDPRLRLLLNNLAAFHFLQGNLPSAKSAAERLLQTCDQVLGAQHSESGIASNNLGVIERVLGKAEDADRLLRHAIEVLRGGETGEPDLVVALNNLACACYAVGKYEEAEKYAGEAREFGARVSRYSPDVATAMNNLGVIYESTERHEDAETLYKASRNLWERTLAPDHPNIAISLSNLSSLFRKQAHHAEAERLFQIASDIAAKDPARFLLDELGPFFMLTSDYPETGLLRMRALRDRPLRSDILTDAGILTGYSAFVAGLRNAPVERVERHIQDLGPWYHNIELRLGVSTNPPMGPHPANRWRILEPFVPADLHSKSVLDIGCNAGFFSIEMKRRGAARVVGVDIMPHVLAQARFVSTWFNQPVELRELDTYAVDSLGEFDYVVFVGVLYHLKHPLYALEKIASVCKDTLYFQSVIRGPLGDFDPDADYPVQERDIFDLPDYPKLYFIEKSFNGDASNWWFASRSCLKAMLRAVGFRETIDTESPDTFVCRK